MHNYFISSNCLGNVIAHSSSLVYKDCRYREANANFSAISYLNGDGEVVVV